ncbi:hypothetical protein [Levilactobacillus sp. HBUAS70063]|uniref:hypothetical protein n=1 Tax=Levilactobacillus sp. HBUAS70063 TaxID=3109359 RepID=UPI003132FBCB
MRIDTVTVLYDNASSKKYSFSNTTTLMSSNGKNTKGKTSLIRFLIWGLGFNVSLTNHFKSAYSETLITLKESSFNSINRRGDSIVLSPDSSGIDAPQKLEFMLPNDENEVLKLLFPNVPKGILPQLIGFMYFDQDSGYKAWNRNIVTQRLGNDRSYKISIETLLAELGNIDYEDYFRKQKYLNKVRNETIGFSNLLTSIQSLTPNEHSELKTVQDDILELNDKISQLELRLRHVKEKRNIYSSSLRDQDNFERLLKKLSIKVRVGNANVDVTPDNILQDKHLKTRLTEFEKYYHSVEADLAHKLDSLRDRREVLISTPTDEDEPEKLFSTQNNFKHLTDLLGSSGIVLSDAKAATIDIDTAAKKRKSDFNDDIKKTSAYSAIWNEIVLLANKVNLSASINLRKNQLLINKISESGAKRSLTVIAYRLGVLKYLQDSYDIKVPLIFDSPASSEMDTDNLQMLLAMITSSFSEFQIIVATNQESNIKFKKLINLNNGVVGTLNK